MSKNVLVRDYMTQKPKVVSPDEDINVVFNKLNDSRIRQAPVVDNGKLVGIITDRDLRMALVDNSINPGLTVKNVMVEDPITISEETKIEEAAQIIIDKKINALPVVNNNHELKGVLTTTDIVSGFIDYCKNN